MICVVQTLHVSWVGKYFMSNCKKIPTTFFCHCPSAAHVWQTACLPSSLLLHTWKSHLQGKLCIVLLGPIEISFTKKVEDTLYKLFGELLSSDSVIFKGMLISGGDGSAKGLTDDDPILLQGLMPQVFNMFVQHNFRRSVSQHSLPLY